MTHPNSATGSDHDGVNLRLVWPRGRAAAHPASESLLRNSRLTPPAAAMPWVRQSSKRSYRSTTAPALQCRCPPEPGGLTSGEVQRIITDIDGTADIVGFTIAEFIPRQVMHLQQLLSGFPLISGTRAD